MREFGLRVLAKIFALTLKEITGSITHVSTDKAVVAVTFDDGPHPVYTPKVLDVLNKHNAKATFFMIGKSASRYPDIVRQVAQGGHAVGNHSWSHPSLPELHRRSMGREVRACAQAIAPFGLKLFRPPYGRQDMSSRITLFLQGYKAIKWNMHAFDWKKSSSEQMGEKLLKDISPGSIILLHDALFGTSGDSSPDRMLMIQALDIFLGQAGKEYCFITVPELLRCGPTIKQHCNWNPGNPCEGRLP
jgi:peptidoglycan/xylan/chitin deacetylase (PgdA/CDA1 family)